MLHTVAPLTNNCGMCRRFYKWMLLLLLVLTCPFTVSTTMLLFDVVRYVGWPWSLRLALVLILFQVQSHSHGWRVVTVKILSQVSYFVTNCACDYTAVIDKSSYCCSLHWQLKHKSTSERNLSYFLSKCKCEVLLRPLIEQLSQSIKV